MDFQQVGNFFVPVGGRDQLGVPQWMHAGEREADGVADKSHGALEDRVLEPRVGAGRVRGPVAIDPLFSNPRKGI